MGSADLYPIIFFAGLTFSLQRIGTVSVLVSISEIVSVSATNTGRKEMFMTSTDWEFADADAMTKAGHDMWEQIKSAGAISFKAAQAITRREP